ncbi:hypothetical protein BGZ76_000125 [Entomortierella beljakovae]|nr:hypothetical protein BGZ76_000125 [Entomortierella beljakovae]
MNPGFTPGQDSKKNPNELGNLIPHEPSSSQPHHHQHPILESMLRIDVVNHDDAAITRDEENSNRKIYSEEEEDLFASDPPPYDMSYGRRLRCHAKLLRNRACDTKVTSVELFFDLVFVFAISSIAHTMEKDLSFVVTMEMLLVTLAVWVQSRFIPGSAIAFIADDVGRSGAAVIALYGHKLQKNFVRILAWFVVTAVLWIVGGAIGGNTRNVLWIVAIIIEYIGPSAGFYTPGIGMSTSIDWDIHGGHLAERCSLFIIIALGESIVVTGDSFAHMYHEPAAVGMFIVAFVGSASMWWIYFHSSSEEAVHHVEHSDDPGKMGRIGFTYLHAPMVVGIIWTAVADRLCIEEPYMVPHHHEGKMMEVAIMIGGPTIFVLGHALFRRTFCARVPVAHIATIIGFLCTTPVAIYAPAWVTATTTSTLLVMLAIYESYFRCYVLALRGAGAA